MDSSRFLGFQYLLHDFGDVSIHQADYVDKILERHGMADCNSDTTPMDPIKKTIKQTELGDKSKFREIVGSLQYLACHTRPDIAFTVGYLARRLNNPTNIEWTIMKRCLSYLKGTKTLGLRYKSQDNNQGLIVYCDADFAGCQDTRRSTLGHITYNGGVISWRSKLQHMSVTSTTEAEFLSLTNLIKVVISLREICRELRLIKDEPTEVHCDNRGAVLVTQNDASVQRTRHLGALLTKSTS